MSPAARLESDMHSLSARLRKARQGLSRGTIIDLTPIEQDEIPAGKALDEFLGTIAWPDAVVGLIIAQRFGRKGLREAIEALARIGEQRLVLLVVGKDDLEWAVDALDGLGGRHDLHPLVGRRRLAA